MRRFQEVSQRTAAGQPVRWTDLALDVGYFDQAHFIHDFQAFAGLTPSAAPGATRGSITTMFLFPSEDKFLQDTFRCRALS